MTGRRPLSLAELISLARIDVLDIQGNPQARVTAISAHAQSTPRNGLFAAITGTRIDSHMMLGEAVDAGASVLVVENETQPYPGVTTVRVKDSRAALGRLAHAFYRNPARAMTVCGITGTNGKSSTSHLLYSILKTAGANPGLIGTLGVEFGGKSVRLDTTTPDPISMAEIFDAMDAERVDFVVMEVSSHAVDQDRIAGIPFRCGAFLNITQDHLDYHGSFEAYAGAKYRFFADYVGQTPGSIACYNADDPTIAELMEPYGSDTLSFSQSGGPSVSIHAGNVDCDVSGTHFDLCIDGKTARVEAALVGRFNVENMLAAAACAHGMGIGFDTIVRGLSSCPPVPGRFEFLREGQDFSVVVDYAHTPDALFRLLQSARRLCKGRLITVFGCGGDRDKSKRAVMGSVVGDQSDFAIVTSDNPRTEDPAAIARQTLEGVLQSSLKSNRYQVVVDRREAIAQALHLAETDDLVIIAGKGHEDYQDVGSTRLPFDDRLIARSILRQLFGAGSQREKLETLTEQAP